MKLGLMVILLFGPLACSMFERNSSSGYSSSQWDGLDEIKSYESSTKQRQKMLSEESQDELGISSSRELSENEKQRLDLRVKLRGLEAKLNSKQEKLQYYKYKASLRSDAEKIEFLSMEDFYARERWAADKGLMQKSSRWNRNIASVIETQDIALGMSRDAVRESWGDPSLVEAAGDNMYGNERWSYTVSNPSPEGFVDEHRVIYFEGGQVVGWEKQ